MAAGAITLDAILARGLAYHGQGREVGGWTVVLVERIGETRSAAQHRIVIADTSGREYEGRFEHGPTASPWEAETTATFTPRQRAREGARS
ncbi:hypothetical protein ACRYCC_26030 [Actinomadura scrupuli]|uniref:hypothetical protein n=1 Tax=Actinomadura scrupuli TaxID=559629 RepID=UPI003D994C27